MKSDLVHSEHGDPATCSSNSIYTTAERRVSLRVLDDHILPALLVVIEGGDRPAFLREVAVITRARDSEGAKRCACQYIRKQETRSQIR
jgi:hypothetical protein